MEKTVNSTPGALLRLPQVLELVPIGKSTLWLWVKIGKFPHPIKLSARTTCWRRIDVERFIAEVSGEGG